MASDPTQADGVRKFTWCLTDDHGICATEYRWNTAIVRCACDCHGI